MAQKPSKYLSSSLLVAKNPLQRKKTACSRKLSQAYILTTESLYRLRPVWIIESEGIKLKTYENHIEIIFFSGIIFHYQLSSIHNCEDRFHFVSSTAVYICYFHVFTVMNLPREGFICNQHNDQLPVDLLSQLVERCTDIKNVK